jgi:glycosyltransferase involved in cell wall biosynthesis
LCAVNTRADYFVKASAEAESMNANDFKVSVVIPTFNRAVFLEEAIQSVLAQTWPVYEIIVVDDGSTDNTPTVIAAYGDKIRYFKQKNQGPSAARNYAMREARGNWIAFLDSDDLWVREKIQIQTEFVRQHPYLEFVFGNLAIFSENHSDVEPEILNLAVHEYLQANAADLKDFFGQLLLCNPVPTSSMLFRSDCLRRAGFLDETMRYCEDYDFLLRLAGNVRAGFVDRILVKRRMHGSNAINAHIAICEGALKAFKRCDKKSDLPAEVRRTVLRRIAAIQYDLASALIKRGRFDEAYVGLTELQVKDMPDSVLLRAKIAVKKLLAKTMGKGNKATDQHLCP